jgi:GNAT superfamily N-acetyltransferase
MTPRLVGHREFDGRSHPSFRDIHEAWPEFLLHDRTVNVNWDRRYAEFADFQFYLVEDDTVLAEGNTIPVAWDGSLDHAGIDWAFVEGSRAGRPTTLCAVQVMIRREAHGRGLSAGMLERMTQLAAQHGLDCLIAPVRPTLKHRIR